MRLSCLTEIINLENIRVKSILEKDSNHMTLYLEPVKVKPPECSGCGRQHNNVHSTHTVKVEDLSITEKRVFFIFEKRKTKCTEDECIYTESFSWLRGNVTKRFSEKVFRLTSITSNQEAGWFMGLDDEKVYRIDKSILEEKAAEKLEPIPEVKNGSVDEVAWQKWHHYVTNFIDIDKRVVIWNHDGRGKETLSKFYKKLGKEKSSSILSVAMDGARGYIEATKKHASQALIVLDKFHLVKKFNEATDEVRKEELRFAKKTGNEDLQKRLHCGERWLLLKNKPTETQKERLDELLKLNANIAKAVILKEEFLSIYAQPDMTYQKAGDEIFNWIMNAKYSKLKPFAELADSLGRKFEYVENYFKCKISSAISEGFNNKIKRLKRMAYGYRDVDYFLLKIHQHCGLLNPRLST